MDWVAGASVVVASAAVVYASRSAKQATRAADAAADLVRLEEKRYSAERLAARSSRGVVAHLQAGGMGGARIVYIYNLGPGSITVNTVNLVRDNGSPVERVSPLTFSDTPPVTLHRGEYTRIDFQIMSWSHMRFNVEYMDASGHHEQRVRIQVAGELPSPTE